MPTFRPIFCWLRCINRKGHSPDIGTLRSSSGTPTRRGWEYLCGQGFLVLFGLLLWGCNEPRFDIPSDARLRQKVVEKRLRSAPIMQRKGTNSVQQPKSIPADLRWESVSSHVGTIHGLGVDPAGEYVLSAGADQKLFLWHLPSHKKVRSWRNFQHALHRVQFSPDGRRFLVLEGTNKLSVWATQGHRLGQKTVSAHLHDAVFAPLSNEIWAVSRQGMLHRFHGIHVQELAQTSVCRKGQAALRLAIDPSQRWLAVGCSDGQWILRTWDGKQIYQIQQEHPVSALAFSPTGSHLAVATQAAVLQLWQIHPQPLSCRQVQQHRGHIRWITQVQFHANQPLLATGSLDHHLHLWEWNAQGMTLKQSLAHAAGVSALAFGPEGQKYVVSGDQHGHLSMWSLDGQRLMEKTPPAWQAQTLSFSTRDDLMASDTGQHGVGVWDLRTGQLWMSLQVHPFSVLHVEFAQDGNRLLSVDKHNVVFWDLQARQTIGILYAPERSEFTAAVLGRDWTQVFYGTDQKGVELWTMAGPKRLYQDQEPRCVSAIAYHVPSRTGAVATCQGILYLYDFTRYQRQNRRVLAKQPILRLQFSPDGKRLLVLTRTRATLWELPKLQLLAQTTPPTTLSAGAFLPSGHTVLLGGSDRKVWQWSLASSPLKPLFQSCNTPIRNIHVSLRRSWVAVSCFDGRVQLWELSKYKHLLTWAGLPHQDWLVYSPDLFFVSSEGALRHFHLRTQRESRTWSSSESWFFQPDKIKKQLAFPKPLPQ